MNTAKAPSAFALLLAGLLVPWTTSAQAPPSTDCADCDWLPGAWCRYLSDGEFAGCTQCNYWYCCVTGDCEEERPEQVALGVAGDGSVLSSVHPLAARRSPQTLAGTKADGVVVNCNGTILARYFGERGRREAQALSRQIVI